MLREGTTVFDPDELSLLASILDQAVASAARNVAYRPAQQNCTPAVGEYLFTYTFPQQ